MSFVLFSAYLSITAASGDFVNRLRQSLSSLNIGGYSHSTQAVLDAATEAELHELVSNAELLTRLRSTHWMNLTMALAVHPENSELFNSIYPRVRSMGGLNRPSGKAFLARCLHLTEGEGDWSLVETTLNDPRVDQPELNAILHTALIRNHADYFQKALRRGAVVSALPAELVHEKRAFMDSLDSNECQICMEPLNSAESVSFCKNGHNLHRDCLARSLQHNAQCPICRSYTLMTLQEFHELYAKPTIAPEAMNRLRLHMNLAMTTEYDAKEFFKILVSYNHPAYPEVQQALGFITDENFLTDFLGYHVSHSLRIAPHLIQVISDVIGKLSRPPSGHILLAALVNNQTEIARLLLEKGSRLSDDYLLARFTDHPSVASVRANGPIVDVPGVNAEAARAFNGLSQPWEQSLRPF